MTNSLLTAIDETSANAMGAYASAGLLSEITGGDKKRNIPAGSSLPFFESGKGKLGDTDYQFNGSYCKRDSQQPSEGLLKELALPWLNAPYLWGGRTPLGVDC